MHTHTHIWTKWGWFVFLLLPFYPAWCGGGLLGVEGMVEVVIPRSALSVIARLCLFTPAKMSWSSRPFDPALMSPQYVSLSESRAPLHNPVIGKRNVTKRCSLNILNGVHQRFVSVIECVEETNPEMQRCGACKHFYWGNKSDKMKRKRKNTAQTCCDACAVSFTTRLCGGKVSRLMEETVAEMFQTALHLDRWTSYRGHWLLHFICFLFR